MHARVDHIAVYAEELTPTDVTALKNGTKPSALPASAGLIAYWDFNDASAPLPTLTATYSGGVLTMTYTGTLVSAASSAFLSYLMGPGKTGPIFFDSQFHESRRGHVPALCFFFA